MTAKIMSLEGKIEKIKLHEVNYDSSYQRDVQQHHRHIAKNFDPVVAGVLTVARRADNSLWCLDGRQRIAAMISLGITEWKSTVVESSGQKFEAQLFKTINSKEGRKGLSTRQMFHAALAADDPIALECVRAAGAAGMTVVHGTKGSTKAKELGCVGALYRTCKQYGGKTLERALTLINNTWPDSDDAVRDGIVVATVQIVASRGDVLDEGRFIHVLGNIHPKSLLLQASAWAVGSRFNAVADAMIQKYNSRLRDPSKILKLFSDKAPPEEKKETV